MAVNGSRAQVVDEHANGPLDQSHRQKEEWSTRIFGLDDIFVSNCPNQEEVLLRYEV